MLTVLLLSAATASAQRLAAVEPRARVDRAEVPWRGIGKLQSTDDSLRTTCTGALVGSRTVLTAAHCLAHIRTGPDYPPSSLHFLAGFEGQNYAAAAVAVELLKGGFDSTHPDASRGGDWAVIVLESPIGTADRLLPVSERPPLQGSPLMVGGYGQDNPNVLTAGSSCRGIGYSADAEGRLLIRHDYMAMHGVSGAPLLVGTSKGWSVAGINIARSRLHVDGLAVTLDEVRGRL